MATAASKPNDDKKTDEVKRAGQARAASKDAAPGAARMISALEEERRGYVVRNLPERARAVDAQIDAWKKRA